MLQTAPCLTCQSPVEYDPDFSFGGGEHGVLCLHCIQRQDEERRALCRLSDLHSRWERICPPRFHNTAANLLPYPSKSNEALEWSFENGVGLNLWGHPDTGKTRSLYLVLHKLHMSGMAVKVFGPGEFGVELAARDFARHSWLKTLFAMDVIAFDDMDKMNLSKEQELVFFGLLDKRMTQKKPCMFTHNSTAEELEYRFRNGKAMVRRIRQFAKSIHFPERLTQAKLL